MKYGPNTVAVERLLQQARRMTSEQREQVAAARVAAMGLARDAAWYAVRDAAQDADRIADWCAARDAVRGSAAAASWDAAAALVVRDLISGEHFNVLYGPWASVFGPPAN